MSGNLSNDFSFQAIAENLLYVLYHEEHNDLVNVPDKMDINPTDSRTLMKTTSPITLFIRNQNGGLKLAAIQLDYKPGWFETVSSIMLLYYNILHAQIKKRKSSGDDRYILNYLKYKKCIQTFTRNPMMFDKVRVHIIRQRKQMLPLQSIWFPLTIVKMNLFYVAAISSFPSL